MSVEAPPQEEIARDETGITVDDDFNDEDSDFTPTLFVMSGIDTSLDEIILEDCLTKVLSPNYDISNDEKGDEEEDEENFLPTIMVTLLEADYNDEKGKVLFCIDRSLVLIGDQEVTEEEVEALNRKFDVDVLTKMREYVSSEEAKTCETVWIVDPSNATIEMVADEDIETMTEGEAYDRWLKHNEVDGNDNANVVPEFQDKEEKTEE